MNNTFAPPALDRQRLRDGMPVTLRRTDDPGYARHGVIVFVSDYDDEDPQAVDYVRIKWGDDEKSRLVHPYSLGLCTNAHGNVSGYYLVPTPPDDAYWERMCCT